MCAWIRGIPVLAVGFKGAKPLESPPEADGEQPQKYLAGGWDRERMDVGETVRAARYDGTGSLPLLFRHTLNPELL